MAVPLAYLIGTIPCSVIVGRAFGADVTAQGSGNPGASNVMRVAGWKAGLLAMIGDTAKGTAPAAIGLVVEGRWAGFALGIAAVIGHVFPIVRRGGKGVATAGGMLFVLFPWIALAGITTWMLVAKGLRKASIASLFIVVAFPIVVGIIGAPWWETLAISALALVLISRHSSNIRRLIHREEVDLVAGSRSIGDAPAHHENHGHQEDKNQ